MPFVKCLLFRIVDVGQRLGNNCREKSQINSFNSNFEQIIVRYSLNSDTKASDKLTIRRSFPSLSTTFSLSVKLLLTKMNKWTENLLVSSACTSREQHWRLLPSPSSFDLSSLEIFSPYPLAPRSKRQSEVRKVTRISGSLNL